MEVLWILCPLIMLGGMIDAIAGGGGLITLSAYYAVGLPPHIALGTNKFSAVWGTVTASWRYIRSGHVSWRYAVFSIVGALAGSLLGAAIALRVSGNILRYMLLVVVPLVMVLVLRKPKLERVRIEFSNAVMLMLAVACGFVIGVYDGFFGPGTGVFMTMAFSSILRLDMITASGNARVVNLASNLAAIVVFIAGGTIDYAIGIPCAVASIIGNFIGSEIAIKGGGKVIRTVMIVVLSLLLVKIVMELFL